MLASGGAAEAAAAQLLEEHVACWRVRMQGAPVLRAAWRLERAGDLYAALEDWPRAASSYLSARNELARLGVQPAAPPPAQEAVGGGGGGGGSSAHRSDGRAGAVEAKLAAALRGATRHE